MRIKTTIFIIILSILFLFAYYDNTTVYENGDYSVGWIDLKERQALRFRNEGIIDECVSKLGENKKFIIVERVLIKAGLVKEYYIIDKKQHLRTWNKKTVEGIIGPLNNTEFQKMKKKLHVSDDLEFTVVSNNCD